MATLKKIILILSFGYLPLGFAQNTPPSGWGGNWDCQGTVIGNKSAVNCTMIPFRITLNAGHFSSAGDLTCPQHPEIKGGLNLNYAFDSGKLFNAGHEVGFLVDAEMYATVDDGRSPYLAVFEFDMDKSLNSFSYTLNYQDRHNVSHKILTEQFTCLRHL